MKLNELAGNRAMGNFAYALLLQIEGTPTYVMLCAMDHNVINKGLIVTYLPLVPDGYHNVPAIRPLETLHNALSLKQLDSFLERVTSSSFRISLQAISKLSSSSSASSGNSSSSSQPSALPIVSPSNSE